MPPHPAFVHVPLGLAFVVPLLALGLTVGLFLGRASRRSFAVVLALQAVLVMGALAALQTGQLDEAAVGRAVGRERVGAHEDAADAFFGATIIGLLAAGATVVAKRERAARAAAAALVVASFGAAALGWRAGRLGGELVYVHGAARVHAPGAPAAPPTGP